MTITSDPTTPSIHQQFDHPRDQEGQGRSDKQSPNRAGIRMPRGARPDRGSDSIGQHSMTKIVRFPDQRMGV